MATQTLSSRMSSLSMASGASQPQALSAKSSVTFAGATGFAASRVSVSATPNGTREEEGRRSLAVRAAGPGGFIPSDHKWMYEGVENMGPDVWNRTYYPKAADHVNGEKKWFIVDASNKRLGRLASSIAMHIRGKTEPTYTPSIDMGAYVIVVNAEKVEVTGKKRLQKLYRRHSGRPGGMKVETFNQMQERIPERIIEHAVKGMLPKGRLGRRLFTHLKVFKGDEHPHEAQAPLPLEIKDKNIDFAAEM